MWAARVFFAALNSNTAGGAARSPAARRRMRDFVHPAHFEKRRPDSCLYSRAARIGYGDAPCCLESQTTPDENAKRQYQGGPEKQADAKPVLGQRILRIRAWPMGQLFQVLELFGLAVSPAIARPEIMKPQRANTGTATARTTNKGAAYRYQLLKASHLCRPMQP